MPFTKLLPTALNPSLDVTLKVDGMPQPEAILEVLEEERDAAGKATNVARVLKRFGTENTLLLLSGRENEGDYFRTLSGLPEESRPAWKNVSVSGNIREIMHVILPGGRLVTIRKHGFTVGETEKAAFIELLKGECVPDSLVLFCGRLPEGISREDFRVLCRTVTEQGGQVAVDSNSVTYEDLLEIKPFLIKPNREELEQYTGKKFDSLAEMKAQLQEMNRAGIRHILLSLGGDGLLYCGEGICVKANVPQVKVESPVGAGDSTLAGFVTGLQRGMSLPECAGYAASFGTAAVLLSGTKPPEKTDVERIYAQVKTYSL